MTPVLYAALGWVAGLFSSILLEWNRDRRLVKSLRTALHFELVRFRYRMAGVVFFLNARAGTLNPQKIQWILDEFVAYTEPDKDQNVVTALQTMQQYPQQAAAVGANFAAVATQRSPALKKYPTPALQTAVASISLFSREEQKEILELSTLGANFEAVVDEAWRFFEMTFGPITPQNLQSVQANLNTAYAQAAELCQRLANQAARVLAAG